MLDDAFDTLIAVDGQAGLSGTSSAFGQHLLEASAM